MTQLINITEAVEIVNRRVKPFSGKRHYLATGDLTGDRIDDLVTIEYKTKPSRADLLVNENNIIIARMQATNKVLLIDKSTQGLIVSTGFLTLVPREGFDPFYLMHYFRSHIFQRQKDKYCSGATQKAINNDAFKKLQIPFHAIEEQERIAKILNQTDFIRQKRKQSFRLLEEFLLSIFFYMFGDPVKNSKKWKTCKVIDVTECIVPGRDKPRSFTGSIPWVTTEDLKHLGITTGSSKGMGLTQQEIRAVRARIIPGDSVIMTCVGDLGTVSISKKDFVINQQLHAFVCGPEINNIFLMFNLAFQKAYMYLMASSTTLPYMNKSICNSIPILLPPINLQEKFCAIFNKTREIEQKAQQSCTKIDNQFDALVYKYFS